MRRILTALLGLAVLAAVWMLGNRTTAALPPAPAALNPYAATDGLAGDGFAGVWTDGAGTWLAGYNHGSDPLGPVLQRSTDGGATWTFPVSVPMVKDVATDADGTWLAVDIPSVAAPSLSDVIVSRSTDNGLNWSGPAVLATGVSDAWEPRVATDGLATWMVVWAAPDIGPGTDIFASRSINDGLTWSPPQILSVPGGLGGDDSPQVATDGQGTWLVTWRYSYDSVNNMMRVRSTNNGATWSSPAIAAGPAYAGPDDLAADGAGNWLVAWDGYVSRSTDGGLTWSDPISLPGDEQRLAFGGPGNWLIASQRWGTPWGYDEDIFVSRSTDGGATWSVAVPLNVNAPTDSRHDVEVEIAADSQNHLVAVWESYPLDLPPERDIYYTYCSLSDGGPGPPCQLPTCTEPIGLWLVPIEDEDCDGFSSTAEGGIGTLPLVACAATIDSNDEAPDAWPSDANDDQDADIGDAVMLFRDVLLNPPNYQPRSDMDVDGDVDIGDVIAALGGGKILASCG